MSQDDEKVIVELTTEEYQMLKEMLKGQAAWAWVRNRSKMLAIWFSTIIAALFALSELISRLGHHAVK